MPYFARKYPAICSFRKYTFQCLGLLNFADVSNSFAKKQRFLSKKVHSKQQCESCVRDFLVLFSVFVRQKVTATEKNLLQTLCPEFSLQTAPNWAKIAKMTMTSIFFLTLFCFYFQVQLLVQVSCQCHYWFWNYNNFLL